MPYRPTILKNAQVVLGTASQDISDHVQSVRLTQSWAEIDDTRMGVAARSRVPGLETWDAQIDIIQDFESTGAAIEKTLAQLAANSALSQPVPQPVRIRAVAANKSSDNPEWSGLTYIFSHQPINGQVGELLKTSVSLLSASTLSRSVSTS